jgi:hypothetical protein
MAAAVMEIIAVISTFAGGTARASGSLALSAGQDMAGANGAAVFAGGSLTLETCAL